MRASISTHRQQGQRAGGIPDRARQGLPAQRVVHPVRIARFHVTRFSPRVGCPETLCFIGSGVRFSKVWVQKDENLITRIGCNTEPDEIESLGWSSPRERGADAQSARLPGIVLVLVLVLVFVFVLLLSLLLLVVVVVVSV